MTTLIYYEKKKLLKRKSAMIACLLMVLCIFAISLVFISDQFWFREDGTLVRSFSLSFLLIALAVCVIISPVFAWEYQTGADAVVLAAKRGRRQVVLAKIAAGFIVTSQVYALGVCTLLLCVLVPFGAGGWNCEFQLLSETSFYNMKIWQVVPSGILINYIVILSVMASAMLLSAMCTTPFAAVIVSMLYAVVPMFIPAGSAGTLMNHILALLPAKAMETYTVFSAYTFFPIGKAVITLPYMIPIAAAALIMIALPFAHRRFCKHQVA